MSQREYDAIVVGAGFSGLYLVYKLREQGFSVLGLEQGPDVGGTWFWNRYPGARCDVASMDYSYSFSEALQQEWNWSERYASQPEILRYLNHVADRFALRPHFRFGVRVGQAVYEHGAHRWAVRTEDGAEYRSQFCIMATGVLSSSRIPDLPGLADFSGPVLHTGRWPDEPVEISGKRVAVIGTGSSGIQVIPELAQQAQALTVFQRTPNFSLPAGNRPLENQQVQAIKSRYAEYRKELRNTRSGAWYEYATQPVSAVTPEACEAELERRWNLGGANFMHAYADFATDEAANAVAADFVRRKISQTVNDADVARRLCPTHYPIGTKRICLDTNYFQTFNRDHVELVDLQETPLERITARGVRTTRREYPVDLLVCATGFDAMTGALLAVDIRTDSGASLRRAWAEGPVSYLGLMVAGFPNLFTVTGPGSPSVISNMVASIEQHVEWIAECLVHLRENEKRSIEACPLAQAKWVAHVREVADGTLYPRAASWYMGANIPGKPRVFMPYLGGVAAYAKTCAEVVANGYRGFDLRSRAEAVA